MLLWHMDALQILNSQYSSQNYLLLCSDDDECAKSSALEFYRTWEENDDGNFLILQPILDSGKRGNITRQL